ncbi:MAG TPA: 1-acyl-sn-glycerol-3-phosphate acyltransferase [Micromonosporaceae bacterium]
MSVESLWLPRSWCGTACLPPARGGVVAAIRSAGRLAAVVLVLLATALLTPVVALVGPVRWPTVRLLARALLAVLGVRTRLRGRLRRPAALVVANHVSWLDILVLLAHQPACLVAKHQVRDWPLVGRLAAAIGTVFIDRTRPRTLPGAVARAAAVLRAGQSVAVFPEATTWCGRAVGRFRAAMFQAAIDARVPVVPVSLRYRSLDGETTAVAAFLGEDTIFASVLRIARVPGLLVAVDVHPALHPGPGATRAGLARAAKAMVYGLTAPGAHPVDPPCTGGQVR